MIMDDSAPTHERRKLVKTYKNVSLENGLWLLRYAERLTQKNDKIKDGCTCNSQLVFLPFRVRVARRDVKVPRIVLVFFIIIDVHNPFKRWLHK